MPTAQEIVEQLEVMKTLPSVAVRLTRMISDDTYSLAEFEAVIRLDPTLVLRLLKIVNSPFYALASKVESIAEAVAFVGMDNLRNLIVLDIFNHLVREAPSDSGFSRKRIWLHSAAVGITSQIISERIFEQKGENAFLSGLIHDIGLIIEDQIVPDAFSRACQACLDSDHPITVHERQSVGTDHTKVGAAIARDWNLPLVVQEGIRDHHNAGSGMDPKSMAGILQIAEYLVFRLDYSVLDGKDVALCPSLLKHIHKNIQEYKAVAMDLPGEIRQAEAVFGESE